MIFGDGMDLLRLLVSKCVQCVADDCHFRLFYCLATQILWIVNSFGIYLLGL